MLNGVGGEIHNTHIVAVHDRGSLRRTMKLCKELAQPAGLSHAVSTCTVLYLGTGAGHGVLAFG